MQIVMAGGLGTPLKEGMLLLISAALAGKWDGMVGDIQASGTVSATPEAVSAYLMDLDHLRSILSEDCVGLWENGSVTQGLGASALVRYDMGMLHRKLTMTLSRAESGRWVEFDHPGNKGFVTRWTVTASGEGSSVTVLTPLNQPPWPFKGYFFRVVQPEWQQCYQQAITALDAAL